MTQKLPNQTAATARSWINQHVPCLDSGLINWGQVEDDLPTPESDEEFFVEVASLDLSKLQSSNLHPYYHSTGDKDCVMVAVPTNPGCVQPREEAEQQIG